MRTYDAPFQTSAIVVFDLFSSLTIGRALAGDTLRALFDLLRKYRDFRLLFIAQLVSNCGDWFATVALLGLVLKATNRAGWAASLVFLSQSVASFIGSLVGGPVADRFDRRQVMLVVSALQALSAVGFVIAVATPAWWIGYVAQAAISFLGAFFGPAANAAVPNLVAADDLRPAASMLGATWGAMLAVGAAFGAGFTALFGRTASFVADALSFVVAGVLIARIRAATSLAPTGGAARQRVRPLADVQEALRYAKKDRVTLALLGSKFGFGYVNGVVGMLALLSVTRYRTGDWGTGVLLGARGLGVVLGPLLVKRVVGDHPSRILRACGFSGFLFAFAYLVVAWSPVIAVGAPFVLLGHIGGGMQWTLSTYGLQNRTPDALRGRIMAGDFALVTFSMTVSFVAVSILEGPLGPGRTIGVLAGVALLWGVVYLAGTPRLVRGHSDSFVASGAT